MEAGRRASHNLEDFRDKFVEPPKPPRPEDLPFPGTFLVRVYAIAALGALAMCITCILHIRFPVVANLLVENVNGRTTYSSGAIVLTCLFFPVAVPMLYLSWRNKVTAAWMYTMAAIYCAVMGTMIAFLGLILPFVVCTLTLAFISACTYISAGAQQGKYALWIALLCGFCVTYIVSTLTDMNWANWLLSIAAVVGPCYLGVNTQKLKVIAYLKNPPGLDEKTKSLIGGLTVLFNTCVFFFPYVRLFGKRVAVHRRWIGSEDIPVD